MATRRNLPWADKVRKLEEEKADLQEKLSIAEKSVSGLLREIENEQKRVSLKEDQIEALNKKLQVSFETSEQALQDRDDRTKSLEAEVELLRTKEAAHAGLCQGLQLAIREMAKSAWGKGNV